MDISALPHTIELRRDKLKENVSLRYIDQTRLPSELCFKETDDWQIVVEAIKRLEVRGAPVIGLAGAAAYVLAAFSFTDAENPQQILKQLEPIFHTIVHARPTAVNLFWAVERMRIFATKISSQSADKEVFKDALFNQVKRMEEEDEAANRAIGAHGAALLPENSQILTHCNAGSLATRFYGTALGVVYSAAQEGRIKRVFIDETRPVGQGARLTAWELSRVGIPSTLICDNMAASIMAQGAIDAIIVGADRICRNGDVVNKIGTYGLAVAAHHHKIPFYVAAPQSTIDSTLAEGTQVIIEQRDSAEVTEQTLPGIEVYNPAFDMTPSDLITATITERGVYSVHDNSWTDLIHLAKSFDQKHEVNEKNRK